MRRPQGFDGPPRSQLTEPRGSAARFDRVTTEPIEVVRAEAVDPNATAPLDPVPSGRPVIDPDATQPIDPLGRPDPGTSAQPRGRGRVPAGWAAWSEVRAAKRALARAKAARRRYERKEVRRFTERSRRRRRAWLIGGGSVVLVSVGLLAIAYSPLMALREVRVEGAATIPAADIQAAFAGDLGTPLPLITSAEVQAALGGFPLIETYSVETVPPDTLVVRVVERTPVGVLETPEGLELVDAAGVVIDRPSERPEGQPVISAGPVTSEGFRAAAGVMRSLPAEVRSQVVEATAATADDVRLVLGSGASVVWGSAEESALKATVLAQLMRSVPPGTVAVFDVSAPMSPGLIE